MKVKSLLSLHTTITWLYLLEPIIETWPIWVWFLVKMLLKKLLLINVRSFLGRKIIKLKRKPRSQVQTKFLQSKLGKHLPKKSPAPNII